MERMGELFSGKEFPTTTHQRVTGWLFTEIAVYLRQRRADCQAIVFPFAVFLGEGEESRFQPDITVVDDAGKLDDAGCHGAPDWVVEVVSPDSRSLDYGRKLAAYIEAGVREYWIVDPGKQTVVAYYLEKPDAPAVYYFGDIIKPVIYEGLEIDTSPLTDIRYEEKQTDATVIVANSSAGVIPEADGEFGDVPQGTPGGGTGESGSREMMSVEEVKAYMSENFAQLVSARGRGQMLKAAMGELKGRADSKTISEAAAQLCRG